MAYADIELNHGFGAKYTVGKVIFYRNKYEEVALEDTDLIGSTFGARETLIKPLIEAVIVIKVTT